MITKIDDSLGLFYLNKNNENPNPLYDQWEPVYSTPWPKNFLNIF